MFVFPVYVSYNCTFHGQTLTSCITIYSRASYPDMGGSWVKQVELDEPMQVSDVHLS